ncbi:MAG: TlyA family RNA methyltransferase [Candidatus Hydrogenedentes bacterium]|nr:TlyA family RNA methyltransferase [Candidatus Hydrogenedentota bacterium]
MPKERLDILIQRLAGVSRSKAHGLILAGQVRLPDGARADKPGARYEEETIFRIEGQQRFVSRGGDKLEAAFEAFPMDVSGKVCIDAGASTGGFTDCLLQHGAHKVYAVDVGYGQLAWSLRQDPRVVVMERCNVRYLRPGQLDEAPEFFTADCSFISLEKILPALAALLAPGGEGAVLIKPQFEAGKAQVGKGGVVRDSAVHEAVVENVTAVAKSLGFQKMDVIPSPLLGPAGNREFVAYLHERAPGPPQVEIETPGSA